jgi:hypothetical protein
VALKRGVGYGGAQLERLFCDANGSLRRGAYSRVNDETEGEKQSIQFTQELVPLEALPPRYIDNELALIPRRLN